ncbi:rhamnogalacturonan acetylesterase [Sphingobacteriaceae bacterium]|nr:rhamnogalacturonan acetylesterase [Sphingobacteriaceae bacterium]
MLFKQIIKISVVTLLALYVTKTYSQKNTDLKFDFGNNTAPSGFIKITPQTKFTYNLGYGFVNTTDLVSISDSSKNTFSRGYITSNKPFFFAVKLPDGNYDVTITLGDGTGRSATTVRAECRRLFLQNVKTKQGEILKQSFTVHVKDSLIRNAEDKIISSVKLKPRERSYLHWDNLLTLEFNDSLPKVRMIEIKRNEKAITVFLAGNSTVVDQDREPWAAWGQFFPSFFESQKICIANYAESGETLKAFEKENRLAKLMSLAKKGDYLFIEFTHNDQKPGGNHLDPFTTYKDTLKSWIRQAKKRNIIPVLVTSMHRRVFDSSGHVVNTLLDYPEAMRQAAREEKVVLIDLNAMSKVLYESWGVENSVKAFVHYPAHTFPGQDLELKDNTHFNPYGAYELARCVISELHRSNLPLKNYLKKDISDFDPSKPDAFSNWYWPLSPLTESVKPTEIKLNEL